MNLIQKKIFFFFFFFFFLRACLDGATKKQYHRQKSFTPNNIEILNSHHTYHNQPVHTSLMNKLNKNTDRNDICIFKRIRRKKKKKQERCTLFIKVSNTIILSRFSAFHPSINVPTDTKIKELSRQ